MRSRVESSSVMMEYERAGVIERVSGGYFRFKWGYGKLLQKLSEAHQSEAGAAMAYWTGRLR